METIYTLAVSDRITAQRRSNSIPPTILKRTKNLCHAVMMPILKTSPNKKEYDKAVSKYVGHVLVCVG